MQLLRIHRKLIPSLTLVGLEFLICTPSVQLLPNGNVHLDRLCGHRFHYSPPDQCQSLATRDFFNWTQTNV